jgi:RHH-type proline utilization regulon transcriptional repressor/proline dehydrogenase/delta 1-pyrroline-5-carboxylate dehydrogenase
MFKLTPAAARLPNPYRPEHEVLAAALNSLQGKLDWSEATQAARPWIQAVRDNPAPFWAMESLLREYPISSAEGLALMRLAEALLRVPDVQTAVALTADQLGRASFDGASNGPHKLMASLSATAISLSKKFLPEEEGRMGLVQRLGAQTVVAATVRAIELMGRQFVLGRNIQEALSEAGSQRKQFAKQTQLRFSYDMLGEGARTEHDAQRYLASYQNAIAHIAQSLGGRSASPHSGDGISIKLSALFSRYEDAQRERVFAELLPRVWTLVEAAAKANINLTIDAEESDRLELSLDVLEALAQRIAQEFPQWQGFGLAVQAYQTRALEVVHEVAAMARRLGLRFMVRLVKGAYWDGEIKRSQEQGLSGYPVFTHKHHTDISYLACARALLTHADVIFPQFATHNAGTIAAILHMAQALGAPFEMQRLHGMGEGIYREAMKNPQVSLRVYAPVGEHRDLLAYLVRRLLENGANSSFVHQLADEAVGLDELLASPLDPADQPGQPSPMAIYRDERPHGAGRANSAGVDLAVIAERAPLLAAIEQARSQLPQVPLADAAAVDAAMRRLQAGFAAWNGVAGHERAQALRRAADAMQARLPEFCGVLVVEAHKTLGDCVAEVREAIDFLRYYADEAESTALAGHQGRGVFVCISPWNFPLAIFIGQVAAALVTGNAVAAKPAEQTPAVAQLAVQLLIDSGVSADALALLNGPGETVGAALVAHPATAGVCFTGSTAVAQIIHRALAAKAAANGGQSLPLIAETGGLNAMIVDSSALPEQVVDAVVQSAFRSAGQRCSALRLLCVHESVADGVIEMIQGALKELRVGDPALLATDVGPVIDDEAFQGIRAHVQRLEGHARLIGEAPLGGTTPRLIPPVAFELAKVSDLQQEIFGPVLHVVRWGGEPDALMAQINALGFGLTLGIQTRIDSRAQRLASLAKVGNVYVNRNIVGAVVGVQPFGGEGLSGTGPKAGGPHYLRRFVADEAMPAGTPAAATASASLGDSHAAELSAADLQRSVQALQQAHEAWAEQPVAQRVQLLGTVLDGLAQDAQWAHEAAAARVLLAQAEAQLQERELPGPTGESNVLRLHGRGVFLVLAHASPSQWLQPVVAALVCGNSVALAGADARALHLFQAVLDRAQSHAGLPQALLRSLSGRPARLAALEGVAGLCVATAALPPAEGAAVTTAVAQRTGAITPLIGAASAQDVRQLYRFCAEQTLTINTAAAGGNAALLAGAGEASAAH